MSAVSGGSGSVSAGSPSGASSTGPGTGGKSGAFGSMPSIGSSGRFSSGSSGGSASSNSESGTIGSSIGGGRSGEGGCCACAAAGIARTPPANAANKIRAWINLPRSPARQTSARNETNGQKKGSISASCGGGTGPDHRHRAVTDDREARPVIRMRGLGPLHQGKLRIAQGAGGPGSGRRREQARDQLLGCAEIDRHRPMAGDDDAAAGADESADQPVEREVAAGDAGGFGSRLAAVARRVAGG